MNPWLLLLIPLLSSAFIWWFLSANKSTSFIAAWFSTAASVACLLIVIGLNQAEELGAYAFNWIELESLTLSIGLMLDSTALKMMLIVTGIGTLVNLFSTIYMAKDEHAARYYAALSLFLFSMTGIVLADNFIMMFIFWELVGLSSYLLIGHWFYKDSAANASKKAFLMNRIGDFGFIIGILLVWVMAGSFHFDQLATLLADKPEQVASLGAITLACLFCGALGKSAQFPLHTWLADAMEGPTPVSALIHAATMVAAGIYMLFRFQLSLGYDVAGLIFDTWAGTMISYLGATTAVIAALCALAQSDIKKILAYSTLSQLGYMVMAIGLGFKGGEAAMFHLYTHAWFKALLFLGAGAIIYRCHHQQDIWKMGGLAKRMPVTAFCFILGSAALMAIPIITSGAYSKEQILEVVHHENTLLFWVAIVVAALTVFYTLRLIIVTFTGTARSNDSSDAKEAPVAMLIPLVILGVLAIISGLPKVAKVLAPAYHEHPVVFNFVFISSSIAIIIGAITAVVIYRGKGNEPLYLPILKKAFGFDFFYEVFLVRWIQRFVAGLCQVTDQFLISAVIVSGVARFTAYVGQGLRQMHRGQLALYHLLLSVGMIVLIYLFVFA